MFDMAPRRARTVSSAMSMRTCRIPSTSRTVNVAMVLSLSQRLVPDHRAVPEQLSGSGSRPELAAQRIVERDR